MRRILTLLLTLFTIQSFAQDTTWVQTFTFDSIATRRANFVFPQELNEKRFEKVLMYYKLKCSPLTPWDSYNCGEWDYLAYTQIYNHTGELDSVQVDGSRYLVNTGSPLNYVYDNWGYNYADTFVRIESTRSGPATVLSSLGMTPTGTAAYPFDLNQKGGRFQMLLTASELIAGGVTAGDLQSIALYISSISNNGDLIYPSISIKATSDIDLTAFHSSGFTEVYNASRGSLTSTAELTTGANELLFYQPFTWNGTDNLVIEFSFETTTTPSNSFLFDTETTTGNNAVNYAGKNGTIHFTGFEYAISELSDVDLGGDVTIAFWSKGLGNSGVNTSILEAYDTLNNRVLNIHFPWSNNNMYWDAGQGSGYDRIYKSATAGEIDNEWHHWAFVKSTSTGEMFIYKDGALWHNGTGLNSPVGMMHRLVIGANMTGQNNWKGHIDEFQLFDVAVDAATIASWYNKKTDVSHPNWSDLLVYHDFDDEEWAVDRTGNDYLLMPSAQGLFDFSELPVAGVESGINRPLINFGQGIVSGGITNSEVPFVKLKEPKVVFEFAPLERHFAIVNAFVSLEEGTINTYDAGGSVISSIPYYGVNTFTNDTITYYQEPYEIIENIEIGRFITPYGIGFDLGSSGFTWLYDVTDYQMYLHDIVDLAAHNTQELIDLKFAFIEGIPPRDVHKREAIWSDFRSYQYSALDDDSDLSAVQVSLSDTSEMFKIKTRITGHGHNGTVNCCEWDSKDHTIKIDGTDRFTWEIWEETACGDNPNPAQGGTWPYAREGWCPGDLVKEYDHDITPFVTPGTTVSLDYDIEDVPTNDQAQGNGNYVMAMDLISYSAPNFQNDAAVVDVLNPNNWDYYKKWNPNCSNPRVIIQNTGEQSLTSCTIRYWISDGNFFDHNWTGNLAFLEKEIVEMPVSDVAWWYDFQGTSTFHAKVINVNGSPGLDEYPNNDEKVVKFDAPESMTGPFLVSFSTNNKAYENKWRLLDESGNIIFERNTLTNSTVYKDTFDLAPGCYSIIIEDTDSDGLGYWYSNQYESETNGTFSVKIVGGPTKENFPRDFGNFHRYDFSIGFTIGIDEADLQEEILLYPNPNDGVFDIEVSGIVGGTASLSVYDLSGRPVLTQDMSTGTNHASAAINMTDKPAGHYIVKIVTHQGVFTKNFVKQ